MSWSADQVYTLPHPIIIDYFKGIPAFQKRLFWVNDLEGIRFDWVKNFIFSKRSTRHSHMRHSLPERGLLVIAPHLYKTGYDIHQSSNDDFWKFNIQTPGDKWAAIDNSFGDNLQFPLKLNLHNNQLKLLSSLQWLHKQTKVPIMYYKCEMWGGLTDEEISIIFNNGVYVYWHDCESDTTFQLQEEEAYATEKTALQKGLEELGLLLPTPFFALHEGSFDWQRYQI